MEGRREKGGEEGGKKGKKEGLRGEDRERECGIVARSRTGWPKCPQLCLTEGCIFYV